MGITHKVRDCPRDGKEWEKASKRLNCSSGFLNTENKYHCLPVHNLTTLLEFCYNRTRINVVKGIRTVTSSYDSNDSDLIRLFLKTRFYYLWNVSNVQ